MTFGKLVRKERKSAGLTQQALADLMGVSKMTIRRIESIASEDEKKSINMHTLIKLSDVLKSYEIWEGVVTESVQHDRNADQQLPDDLRSAVMKLNKPGQAKVTEYAVDLSGNPKYTQPDDTSEQEPD